MKKGLLFVCWLIGHVAVAQQQVTDFGNAVLNFPANAYLIDTINHKALFNIVPEESSERSFWVTDGSAENTRQLKDAFGESPPYLGYTIRKYGYLYLKGLSLWRTDGNKLERITTSTGVPDKMFNVSNRILLCKEHYETFSGFYLKLTSFAWLDSLNYTTQWEVDVVDYQMIDSTLYYLKYNRYTQLYELYKLDKNGGLSKIIITRKIGVGVTTFEYLLNNGVEYYFLNTDTGKKLVTKPVNSTQAVSYEDWGGKTFFPAFVKDTAQQIYFLKHEDSLTVYQLLIDNHLTEKWSVPSDTISKITEGFMPYYAIEYTHWSMYEDKLVFKIHIGVEGLIRYFFNKLDLKKGTFRRSRNLLEYFRDYFYTLSITPLDSETYVLDNTVNLKITYNFQKDSVLAVNPYAVKERIIDLNGKRIQFSGNVYALSGTTKTPLLAERQIFDAQQWNNFFAHAQLGNQLLFVRYSAQCQCYELWANKGEKNSGSLLLSFKEQFQQLIDVSKSKGGYFQGKFYIQTRNNQGNSSVIYETDGTKAGTRKVYTTSGDIINLIKSNEKQLVFLFNNNSNKLLIFEDQTWRLIPVPETLNNYDVYISSEETYVLTKSIAAYQQDRFVAYNELFRVDGDSLALVDKDIEQVLVAQDKLCYLRRINHEDSNPFTLHITDASKKITDPVKEGIYTFGIYGSKLVYQKVVSATSVDCAVMDLATLRTELILNKITPFTITSINEVLIISETNRMYLIKDGKSREFIPGFRIDAITPFGNGIVLENGNNLTYYDLSTYQPSVILRARTHTTTALAPNSTYLIVSANGDGISFKWYYWTLADKKLIEFEEVGRYEVLSSSLVLHLADYMAKTYIWSLSGNKFTKKYQIPYDYLNWKRQAGNDFYLPYTTESRGTELARFGPDSLINLPEIVVGKEGIILGDVFEFGGRIFTYAFSKSSGWQVWRMDNDPSFVLGNESLTEPNGLIVYPNPTPDLLYINTEKTLPYKLINIRGQVLMQGSLSSRQGIDMKQLQSGVYLIQLFEGGRVFVKKVVRE